MIRFFAVALLGFLLLSEGCSLHHAKKPNRIAAVDPGRIAKEVDDIIKATDPNVNIGVSIRSLSSDKVIYEKNAGRHFVPCSTIKLVTLAAALHYLGPSYRFSTRVFTDGVVKKDGSLDNLYLQGSGDPSLMDYELIKLAQEVAQRGITQVTGNIFIDDQIFDDVLWGRGNMWDDRSKGYGAPTAGLNVNYNRLLIKTVPSLLAGDNAVPVLFPKTRYIEIASEAKAQNGGANISVAVERNKKREEWPAAHSDGLRAHDKVIVKGHISKASEGIWSSLSVNDPSMFAATIFREELQRLGVNVKGKLVRQATPAVAIKLAQHDSRSLAEALIDFTKISNNVAHDTLVKAIAAEAGVKPATASVGLKRIGEFLQNQVGIDAGNLVAADGSGLSRYNLITPEQMVKLLSYSANHFHLGAEFMAALSFSGEDGLLRARLNAEKVKGQIRAKSGTMSGLSNLAGYLTDESGERYAFAIMINGFVGSSAPYVALQDRILSSMLVDNQESVANVK